MYCIFIRARIFSFDTCVRKCFLKRNSQCILEIKVIKSREVMLCNFKTCARWKLCWIKQFRPINPMAINDMPSIVICPMRQTKTCTFYLLLVPVLKHDFLHICPIFFIFPDILCFFVAIFVVVTVTVWHRFTDNSSQYWVRIIR